MLKSNNKRKNQLKKIKHFRYKMLTCKSKFRVKD